MHVLNSAERAGRAAMPVAVLGFALMLSAGPVALRAQAVDTSTRGIVPMIEVSAEGQAEVSPDRATISISVQTRGTTASQAGQSNARTQRAVIDTLQKMGIAPEQISTSGYNVYPEYRNDPRPNNDRPTISGYVATNTLRVQVRKLDQVGSVIDASLAKGANMISSLDLYASNTDQARRAAMAQAVERARADAEALARAAGGTLGALLEVSTSSAPRGPIPMRGDMAMARMQSVETPIAQGTETLTVHVTTRWRFVK